MKNVICTENSLHHLISLEFWLCPQSNHQKTTSLLKILQLSAYYFWKRNDDKNRQQQQQGRRICDVKWARIMYLHKVHTNQPTWASNSWREAFIPRRKVLEKRKDEQVWEEDGVDWMAWLEDQERKRGWGSDKTRPSQISSNSLNAKSIREEFEPYIFWKPLLFSSLRKWKCLSPRIRCDKLARNSKFLLSSCLILAAKGLKLEFIIHKGRIRGKIYSHRDQ